MADVFFQEGNIYLIVGATNNLDKYGGKVFKDLKDAGYGVIAINNRVGGKEEIQDTPSYHSLSTFFTRVIELFNEEKKKKALEKIVLVLVIPPKSALVVLKEGAEHGITKAWFQPGAENDEAINYCKENNIEIVHNECIMQRKP